MYFRTRVQIPAPPISFEGLRPSNSPTRALARRSDGSRRSRGSLRVARSNGPRVPSPLELPYIRLRAKRYGETSPKQFTVALRRRADRVARCASLARTALDRCELGGDKTGV